jgi:hypothetical protein
MASGKPPFLQCQIYNEGGCADSVAEENWGPNVSILRLEVHYFQFLFHRYTIGAMNAQLKAPKPPEPALLTSQKIKRLASEAMTHPGSLKSEEIRELGASILRHIEPRAGGKI